MCHVLGRDVAITLPLMSQLVPHFGEDPEDFAATLFEVAPTVMFTVPRYLQKFASHVLVGVLNSSRIKRGAYEFAMRFARKHVRRRWDGTAIRPAGSGSIGCCGRWFSGRSSTSSASTGWSWWSAAVLRCRPRPPSLWQMYGVNVVEMYGQTEEAGGIIAGQRGPFARPGNVGTAVDGVDVTLADDGEVLVRSPDLFDCYWQNDEATREVKRADGWLRTGDIGEWRDGALASRRPRARLHRDRRRQDDFAVLIENALRASPYVAEAVVFGHGRKYLTAVIEIDFDTVADWARANNVGYTGFTSLTAHPQIERLLRVEIDRVNGDLARVEQIKSFPHLAEGARSGRGGRAGDADAEGEAQADVRALPRSRRRDVRRQRRTADRRRSRRCEVL